MELLNATLQDLGPRIVRHDIDSEGPYQVHPEYVTRYPETVTKALGNLYAEYNSAFTRVIGDNSEWPTDYQYCFDHNGQPINYFVQIDMVALEEDFLEYSKTAPEEDVREYLRRSIFEIENSLAKYNLLSRIFDDGYNPTYFGNEFRAGLSDLRERFGKPIALLAVTEPKYEAMKVSELGLGIDDTVTNDHVYSATGFDTFLGPQDYKELVRNGWQNEYLYYARTSQPIANLRKPGSMMVESLLDDPYYRQQIRANTVTLNIDDPEWGIGDRRKINDTKIYIPLMGMGIEVSSIDELAPDSEKLLRLLYEHGYDLSNTDTREIMLRAKPFDDSYGCYGHVRGRVRDKEFKQNLKRGLRERGRYIIQPEFTTPTIVDPASGTGYTYIDRNFFSFTAGRPIFMGGFRSLMPVDTMEAKKGRIHGNGSTVWSPIYPEQN